MANVMNQHRTNVVTAPRALTQKVCIGMGILFIVVGLAGIISPGFIGMHLSLSHNVIHLASGALSLSSGYSDKVNRAYNFSLAFGIIYGLLGLSGFVFGSPGYPGVGHMEADENLLRLIPNSLEFGTADHIVHILISAVFLFTVYYVKNKTGLSRHSKVDNREVLHSESTLKDAKLGRSDINRRIDVKRRTNFEKRI